MATSRRRTAKQSVGQNLNELETRIKKVERRSRGTIGSYSITSDLIAPGAITLDKLDPALLQLLQDSSNNAGSAGDSTEYLFSGDDAGDSLVTGIVDSVISQYDFSTTSASGKNSIYWQSTQPTGGTYTDGDLWFDTSIDPKDTKVPPGSSYTPWRYKETSGQWEKAQLGDAAFRFLDVGKLTTGILDAGIAIRVGTYPLDNAAVGKSRLEITSSFGSPTFTGIRVLRKTADGQTETGGFTQTLEINADTGRLFIGDSANNNYFEYSAADKKLSLRGSGTINIGDATNYLSYDASTSKLTLSGKMLTGSGNELLAIGTNIETTGQDGIRLGPYNAWYRPVSVINGSDPIFKVGANKTNNAITVTKDGDVNVQGVVSPVGGVVKGVLTIRDIQGATNRMLFGQDVESNRDGIKLDTYNLWTISNNGDSAEFKVGSSGKNLTYSSSTGLLKLVGGDIALSGGGSFKTGDGNTRVEMNSNGIFGYTGGTKTFWIDALDGSSSFEGTTNPTGGTIKGKLTIQGTTYAFGKSVMSTPARDGLYLNDNNYWVLSQTGQSATFKAGGTGRYIEWTGSQFNISTDTVLIGGLTAATQSYADIAAGNAVSSLNVLQKLNDGITGVTITSLGYIFSAGKTTYQNDTLGWFIGYNDLVSPRVPVMYIGGAANYMKWTGSALEVKGNITGSTFTGGTFRTGTTAQNRVEMIDDSEKDKIRFPLVTRPDGTTVLSPSESVPANIQVLPVVDSLGSYFRTLQMSSATVSGWRPAPKISLVTGIGSTTNTESNLTMESPAIYLRGPGTGYAASTSVQGSMTLTSGTAYGTSTTVWPAVNFGSSVSPAMSFSSTITSGLEYNSLVLNARTTITGIGDGTTSDRILGRDASGYLRWYTATTGSSYQAGYGVSIDTSTTPDTINNTGYRMNGSTSDPGTARSSSQNRITFGALASVPTGKSDGDIHIEFA